MDSPLIGGFVEKQQEVVSLAWSGKTTGGLASHSDCHEKIKIMSDEDVFYKT
jgi:hypothetical protein